MIADIKTKICLKKSFFLSWYIFLYHDKAKTLHLLYEDGSIYMYNILKI